MRSLSLAMVVILVLTSGSSCFGVISTPQEMISNISFSIADTNMELGFMMDSEINRMLAVGSTKLKPGTYDTLKPPALFGCGQGKSYCLPPPNSKKPPGSSPYLRRKP
ncbi:hypothetical protein JCGZ_19971 [Jatropha curcas]|uniref:Uncharacterized protein n=1 Tax=Jatropha curcas TaxID=180498 RepID=A0A067JTS4_JATCU|nr:hypothetical protein JCGZ_19971 [Jatropha curcas]